MQTTSSAAAAAPATSPDASRWKTPGRSSHPRSAHSPSGSTSRWARPSQPVAGPISPRVARFRTIHAAQRTARSVSPFSRCRWCARSSHATQSSSRPSMTAAKERSSRSGASSGDAAWACTRTSCASSQARFAQASRPRSSSSMRSGTGLHWAMAREQRKVVTVLFCDLAGSTALGETLDPERLRALLARLLRAHAARSSSATAAPSRSSSAMR